MPIFGWGNTIHGELGLGGIEDEFVLTPRQMTWNPEQEIVQVSCGSTHTLFVTASGKVFSCGNNDNGQLGHELPTKRPQPLTVLENYDIKQVSCGANHSLALDEWGHIYSWGLDDYGQLGIGDSETRQTVPKILKHLVSKHLVQIACGHNHCLALSNSGELFAWGSNMYGQLGFDNSDCKHSSIPKQITALKGIPISFIACGANHSFALSKSGAVFGWGRNNRGQLGLNDEDTRKLPTQLRTLRSLKVRYIACGEEFSVFLTKDGGVFTCGAGTYGQLGHGNNSNEALPRKVMELMGSTITQIACGNRHTLALVPSRGRVYGFGLGCSGQLGTRSTNSSSVPQVVLGPWVSPSGSTLLSNDIPEVNALTIKQIFSGGDHALVTTKYFMDKIPAVDYRLYKSETQILTLTNTLAKECLKVEKEDAIDMDLLGSIELIFKSLECLNGSFLLDDDNHYCCTSKHHGVDLLKATEVFDDIRKIENESLKQIILNTIDSGLISSLAPSPPDVETLRIYLTLPLYHEFDNSKNYTALHTQFSNAVMKLETIPKKIVGQWWAEAPIEYFEHMVSNFKNVVSYIINFKLSLKTGLTKKAITFEPNLFGALNLLVFLHKINHSQRKEKSSYEIFHLPDLMDHIDIQQEYINWYMDKNSQLFNICNYPFLFDAMIKMILLQTDQALQMHTAMQNAVATGFFAMFNMAPPTSQFIVLNVTRENLVQDTLREIMQYSQADLKKPLKVKFKDEEAEDAGGVRKEFFMLLLKDIIDPKYGMFKEFEDSRAVWFSDVSFETDDMYFLIGIICGLAIYNFTIINLPFPLALYKKLLNEPVDISDLRDLSPTLANSMQSILDYQEDDLEKVFDLTFEITRDIFGESKVELLKPGGDKISVNQQNKKEFVDLYVDFVFNKSVETKFNEFQKGFMKVCWGRVLQIFKPHELMAVVVGNEDYDWHALEASAVYKGDYNSGDETIRWFWEVFHDLPIEEKKNFLLYLTGSDRIPIGGMSKIQIIIQPTTDDRFLPVAHTCFNLLDLPRYKTKERLRFKLLQAIQQTQGFSIV
ncbi:probable E3 ubiquitin-protein ligase HERC4 isoform X2 [Eupeodes corollae]|uniref:probable E3 ubiquitin-protein ligase HERC4 isoform X2 n=1 Tax=Eupeodes corollae TaxID=290404 RepID=UPI0024927399|nr:probable E3 ubiquitin-protein ligase HERC4 isoform X2 [Eupeodes corollae]